MLFNVRENQSFSPFSPESKQMVHEVGNIELCELLETEPKNAVQAMFIILGRRHRLLHVRALLAKRKRRKSEIHQVHDGPPFHS